MKRTEPLAWLMVGLLAGCSATQAGSQLQAGRDAYLKNNPTEALVHFQEAAQSDPNYVLRSGIFEEAVWTYIGRTQYILGRFAEARRSLERALSVLKDDSMARLYLGLALARDGDRSRGLKEIEGGLKGFHDWLEHVNFYTQYGQFWDPGRQIRADIEKTLKLASDKNVDWNILISSGERIGRRMEDEVDAARRSERDYIMKQSDMR